MLIPCSHVYLERRCTKLFPPAPLPPSQLWKYIATSLLNIPHFPTVSWNPRSFSHFFLLQDHALSFYLGTSAMSVQNLFPLALQRCSGTPVLAFSFLRHLSMSITPSMTISFIQTVFLVVALTGLLKQLKLSWMRMQRWCSFILKTVPPNLQQNSVSLESIRSLGSHCFQLALKKYPKFIKTFLVVIISKKKKLSAVMCVTARFGEKSSPYKDELYLWYSVSIFHYHTVSFGYCPWWIMNRRLKQGIFLSFLPIIKFNYVHYNRIGISLQPPLSLSLFFTHQCCKIYCIWTHKTCGVMHTCETTHTQS